MARLHIVHFKVDFKCVLGCICLDISQVMYVYPQKSIFQVNSPSKFCVSAHHNYMSDKSATKHLVKGAYGICMLTVTSCACWYTHH